MTVPCTNILIVRTDRIGDVLLTTPAVAALRTAYPEARISMLVSPGARDVVDGNPHLTEIMVDDKKGAHKGLIGFVALLRLLRNKRFDTAIIYHTKKRANALCFFAGIKHRFGYKNDKFGFLLNHPVDDIRPEGALHEAEYCLAVLRHLGVQPDGLALSMPIKEESERWCERFLTENGIGLDDLPIAAHPGASCVSKRWPPEKFSDLITRIYRTHGRKIVLIGDAGNRILADHIGASCGTAVVNAVGQTSISQLASLLKRCALLISNDSGPVHVAVAVGTPVISIFGRAQAGLSPARWKPLGPKDITIHKEAGCRKCLAHNCPRGFICLESISVDEVLSAADSLLPANNLLP